MAWPLCTLTALALAGETEANKPELPCRTSLAEGSRSSHHLSSEIVRLRILRSEARIERLGIGLAFDKDLRVGARTRLGEAASCWGGIGRRPAGCRANCAAPNFDDACGRCPRDPGCAGRASGSRGRRRNGCLDRFRPHLKPTSPAVLV